MSKNAELHRMATKEHICPFGLKSKDLLERKGFSVNDHLLRSRNETEAFKKDHNVSTTPQTFIDGQRIGGYEDLRKYFGLSPSTSEGVTYVPVIAIFLTCFIAAAALTWSVQNTLISPYLLELFVALSMCVLAIQKLQDLRSFSNQFLGYDLLAQRIVRYAYVYPFAEAYVGIGMLAVITSTNAYAMSMAAWMLSPVALFIGTVGAISVFKAVYIDKRQLKCACVGGNSKVPLGFVSLTENLFMIIAAVWMWIK